jgi:hypothetical protein
MTEEVRPRTLALDVKDRLIVIDFLPQQSNLVDQLLARDIRSKVELSQDEMKEVELKSTGTSITWNEAKTLTKEIAFTEAEWDLMKRQMKTASDESRITPDRIDTILKFQKMEGV